MRPEPPTPPPPCDNAPAMAPRACLATPGLSGLRARTACTHSTWDSSAPPLAGERARLRTKSSTGSSTLQVPAARKGHTRAHKGTQGHTRAHKGTQGHTRANKGTQGHTRAHKGTQGHIKGKQGHNGQTRAHKGRTSAFASTLSHAARAIMTPPHHHHPYVHTYTCMHYLFTCTQTYRNIQRRT